MSEQPLGSAPDVDGRVRLPLPSFEVGIALLALVLCLLYALVFSRMVYDSVLEQLLAHPHPPRYAGLPHRHNAAEWVLLVGPALIGWAGAIASLRYLVRRWSR